MGILVFCIGFCCVVEQAIRLNATTHNIVRLTVCNGSLVNGLVNEVVLNSKFVRLNRIELIKLDCLSRLFFTLKSPLIAYYYCNSNSFDVKKYE